VRVRVTEGKEKSYAARTEMLDQTFAILKQFIAEGGKELVLEEEAALD
jgi:hypothetical protein